jgi:hypothetical protein
MTYNCISKRVVENKDAKTFWREKKRDCHSMIIYNNTKNCNKDTNFFNLVNYRRHFVFYCLHRFCVISGSRYLECTTYLSVIKTWHYNDTAKCVEPLFYVRYDVFYKATTYGSADDHPMSTGCCLSNLLWFMIINQLQHGVKDPWIVTKSDRSDRKRQKVTPNDKKWQQKVTKSDWK